MIVPGSHACAATSSDRRVADQPNHHPVGTLPTPWSYSPLRLGINTNPRPEHDQMSVGRPPRGARADVTGASAALGGERRPRAGRDAGTRDGSAHQCRLIAMLS